LSVSRLVRFLLHESTKRITTVIVIATALATVFIVDRSLCQGVVSAKYFWFTGSVCVMSLFLPSLIFKKNEIYIVDVLFAFLIVYIFINWIFLNGNVSMHWYLFLLMIPLYVAVRMMVVNEQFRRLLLLVVLVIVLIEALLGLLQCYGFISSFHSIFKITGTFFNPGPFSGFIVTGIPIAIGFASDKTISRCEKWLGVATIAVIIPVLVAAMSRAAWIAAVVGSIPVLWKFHFSTFKLPIIYSKFSKSVSIRILTMTFICLIIFALAAGVYHIKKDSADGRLVIWRASLEAIKEHPLFGAGYGRFSAVYGDAQATLFLSAKGNDTLAMVADSPEYAFNEFVQITVELGIVGLALFIWLVCSTLFSGDASSLTLRASLGAFLGFSFFSYPFSVLPLAILFIMLLALSAPLSRQLSIRLSVCLKIFVVTICWIVTVYSAYHVLPERAAYRSWKTLQLLGGTNAYRRTAEEYGEFYPFLKHEKKFLFEYGQCLAKAERFEESNLIFEEYLCYGSDPMVYNCIGNNFKKMGKLENAECMYIRASQIVPNRHYPLYLLLKLYEESEQTEKAISMANALLNKPVKVQSPAIQEMQKEAKRIKSQMIPNEDQKCNDE